MRLEKLQETLSLTKRAVATKLVETDETETTEAAREALEYEELECQDREALIQEYGYQLFGENGEFDSIVFNVKYRPYLDCDLTEEQVEELNSMIDAFIRELQADKDFVVRGRSGGYFGYNLKPSQILLSDEVTNRLIEETREYFANKDDEEKIILGEVSPEEQYEMFREYIAYTSFKDDVEEDYQNFYIDPELIDKLEKLAQRVNEKEAEINKYFCGKN